MQKARPRQTPTARPQHVSRRVFFASAYEGLEKLRSLAAEVVACAPDIKPVIWADAFPLAKVPFEVFHNIGTEIVAGVFLAAPDDSVTQRGRTVAVPRANVMLELGYYAALLGLPRVAICKYDGVTLPTDLNAVTYLELGEYDPKATQVQLRQENREKLRAWLSQLPHKLENCGLTQVMHGYSGRWRNEMKFSSWRGTRLTGKNSVAVSGYLDLTIPVSGTGYGVVHGTLHVRVLGCEARFRVVDLITDAHVHDSGILEFKSTTLARHRESIRGSIPKDAQGLPHEGFHPELKGVKEFRWQLSPAGPRLMKGKYLTAIGDEVDEGAEIVFTKLPSK